MLPQHEKIIFDTELSIVALVDSIIKGAEEQCSSDIHIDPGEGDVSIRIRVDGALRLFSSLPRHLLSPVISRIKVLSGLRTDEHQSAQDGRFRFSFDDKSFNVRVSICPTYYGENAVLRLLSDHLDTVSLDQLGFSGSDQKTIRAAIHKNSGMILVTGPTGSGKTTTLYSLMKQLNTSENSLVTIEDPIEYALPGVKQIQVNSRTGLTFAQGLRSVLRQDPNIIMVGEIRDSETAGISVNTALTGHLLLSTLHTSDAATALPRLLDMKIEPFLVASTVSLVIGERLVRRICCHCKEKRTLTSLEQETIYSLNADFALGVINVYRGKGCSHCFGCGFSGRVVIAEVLSINSALRECILRKASAREIKEVAVRHGMATMLQDGLQKVVSGVTTVEEVMRVIHD